MQAGAMDAAGLPIRHLLHGPHQRALALGSQRQSKSETLRRRRVSKARGIDVVQRMAGQSLQPPIHRLDAKAEAFGRPVQALRSQRLQARLQAINVGADPHVSSPFVLICLLPRPVSQPESDRC